MRLLFTLILPFTLVLTTIGSTVLSHGADLQTATFYVA